MSESNFYEIYDRRVYEEELRDFLPATIIDAHTHVWKREHEKGYIPGSRGLVTWTQLVARDNELEELEASYRRMFPDKKVIPVIFGDPPCDLVKNNSYIAECSKKSGYKSLYLTAYDTPPEDIERAMREGFSGIKPYLNNSPDYIPDAEIRIFDFLPKEHLEVVDRAGGIVMLHIPRKARLRDRVNLAQLMEIERDFKNLKLIVAHIGRAYAPEDIGDAFEILGKTENMLFDFTANTQSLAISECIKAVGSKRLLFGSDLPITKMRMYRVTENGIYYNVVPRGLYGDVSNDPHMRETDEKNVTTFMYEQLRALRKSAEELKLGRDEIYDIMCGNSAAIFGIKL